MTLWSPGADIQVAKIGSKHVHFHQEGNRQEAERESDGGGAMVKVRFVVREGFGGGDI